VELVLATRHLGRELGGRLRLLLLLRAGEPCPLAGQIDQHPRQLDAARQARLLLAVHGQDGVDVGLELVHEGGAPRGGLAAPVEGIADLEQRALGVELASQLGRALVEGVDVDGELVEPPVQVLVANQVLGLHGVEWWRGTHGSRVRAQRKPPTGSTNQPLENGLESIVFDRSPARPEADCTDRMASGLSLARTLT
jgi:hypothetical protein